MVEGHEDKQENTNRSRTHRVDGHEFGITLTTGLTQTGGRATGAQICGMTLHIIKRHDRCHRRSWLKNSPIQRMEAAFQCQVV